MEQVRLKTELIESCAKREEDKLKAMSGPSAEHRTEQTIAVNDIYVESIKAKLSILDHM